MTPPIPDAAYETAARKLVTFWGYEEHEDFAGVLAFELGQEEFRLIVESAYADGRQSIHAEWAAKIAEDLEPDDPDAIQAQVRRAARAMVEAEIRAEVAAEIRSKSMKWCMDGTGRHLVENCARIAEGGPR